MTELSRTLANLRSRLLERTEDDSVRVPAEDLRFLLGAFDPVPAPREIDLQAQETAKAQFFTASEHPAVVRLRDRIVDLGATIYLEVPKGRQRSLALTALEELQMRANRGLFAPEAHR